MKCFETIRNNTALKHLNAIIPINYCFETIRNNTALKLIDFNINFRNSFETIRNNTALKPGQFFSNDDLVLKPFETTQL